MAELAAERKTRGYGLGFLLGETWTPAVQRITPTNLAMTGGSASKPSEPPLPPAVDIIEFRSPRQQRGEHQINNRIQ